jgi:small subunit ribosomal protein S3
MGHKVHPKIFRIGTIYRWDSQWFNRKDYAKLLKEDMLLKKYLSVQLKDAGIDVIKIDRNSKEVTVTVFLARPGLIIGRGGAGAEDLRKKILKKFFTKEKIDFKLNIQEVAKPNLSSRIMAQAMVADLEKRMPFRRVMKQGIEKAKKAGALGVKVVMSGRLNGAEIARTEKLSSGTIPLQNLRADIDFISTTAQTIYGTLGVKVWIYRGEVFSKKDQK